MLGRKHGQEEQKRFLIRNAGEKTRTGNTKPSSHPGCRGEITDERDKTDLSSGPPGRNHGREEQKRFLIRNAGEKSQMRGTKQIYRPGNRGEITDRRNKTDLSSGKPGRKSGRKCKSTPAIRGAGEKTRTGNTKPSSHPEC